MTNTSIYEIARHTYVQRVQQQRKEKKNDGGLMTLVSMSLCMLFVAMSFGVSFVSFSIGCVLAAVTFWPVETRVTNNDPFCFPPTEEVPSFDMHMQDVAHRLAYMRR